ncbi:unnamed protein product [marine sediment metagenome]|uniref:Uncharacterized protein n=1 Tax=marine sediment metagenome TaxID=412755 RepID=X0TA50_9ZZZZ
MAFPFLFKNKKGYPPVAIIGAFWHYVVYCDIEGIWYLKETKK